jgi:2-polyprenyl-3-methyl-5-hydroxy-6-metoxy-1,4-benzoquinol methylase
MTLPDGTQPPALVPWCAGGKLPWNDPQFSERMLTEHLSQAHDEGSRRLHIIDDHVQWIHREVLRGKPSRILDLGCGPGLYTERFARLGHTCVGIDFSPAAIRYAQTRAAAQSLSCQYVQEDLTSADFGQSFDFAMFLFGELNAFPAPQARSILRKTCEALAPGGKLLLEMFELKFLMQLGMAPKMQNSVPRGVFAPNPYTRITERKWFSEHNAVVERHTIVESESRATTYYANTLQGYTQAEYSVLLKASGFRETSRLPCLGSPTRALQEQHGLCVLLSEKPGVAEVDTRESSRETSSSSAPG